MNHRILLPLLFSLPTSPLFAQPEMHMASMTHEASLIEGLGKIHHPVATKNLMAQTYFDQGFALIYGFNMEEAILSFQKAGDIDPGLAMAYWGIALATGPNYNMPVDWAAEKKSYDAISKARELSKHAGQQEKDYIAALSKRFTLDTTADLKQLDRNYAKAMKALTEKYPHDLDAKALYAVSLMELHPWDLWFKDGTPNENTGEIISVLESILKVDSNHIGGIHYYIHAVEASPHPELALPYSKRLAALMPGAGHIVHMPAHIYIRVGDYANASKANIAAAKVDSAYIAQKHVEGMYPLMYYNHNLNFLAVSSCFEGNFKEAVNAANRCMDNSASQVAALPMLEQFTACPVLILAAFHRWDDVLNYNKVTADMPITSALLHYAKGLAYAEKKEMDKAKNELIDFEISAGKIPKDAPFGLSIATDALNVARLMLLAKLEEKNKNYESAIALLQQAAKAEDNLHYNEPPDWYLPVRTTLGRVLIEAGKYEEAEKAFTESLVHHPNNGRDYFGLYSCSKLQQKNSESQKYWQQFQAAWKNADMTLSLDDL